MQKPDREKIKVLIVDDSYVSQKLHRHIIESDGDFEIAGIASNGREAIALAEKLQPHVISMDLKMPFMDGMEATRFIMQTNPVPIVVVTSLYDPTNQKLAMEVLEAGAVIIMPKPYGYGHSDYNRAAGKYLRMLKSMSEVKVVRRRPNRFRLSSSEKIVKNQVISQLTRNDYQLLVIGASAGGPEGLKTILAALKPGFPIPVLIVQHIDRHFTEGYRLWLQSCTKISVLTANEDQILLPGHAYLAPGDRHLIVKSNAFATLSDDDPVRGHRPSVGPLFSSAGDVYGDKVIAVILSGMGSDGVHEMKRLRELGALTIAQNKASSLVFGMPGEAVRLGAVSYTLSPEEITKLLLKIFKT